jgi:CBS domain containing-hemolysin-like protein
MWPSASVLFNLASPLSTTVVLATFVFTALLSTTVAFTTVVFTTVVFTTVASPTVCRRSLISVVQFTLRPLARVVDLTGGTLAAVFQAAGL